MRAQCRVPGHEADVHANLAVEIVEHLGGAVPLELRAFDEGLMRNAFDLGQHRYQIFQRLLGDGCQREAAIAADIGGHAMLRMGANPRIPGDLRVIMGVGVDKSGRDDQP